MSDDPVKLDDYHAHEVLHVCNLICNLIDSELISHPWTQAHPKVSEAIQTAKTAMFNAYQVAGREIDGNSGETP